ncbi:MAG: DUF423 domain-containing protein [Gammaproteobacteria bacterium]|nr:MAG: DUF423 domain-containing protein [Gammaproteobacteria bacterium]
MRTFALLGAVFGGVAVALGAFAAHALAARVEPRMLEVFETAARYQMFHALALFAVAWVGRETRAASARLAGWAFVIGIVLFSGSLYAMVFSGVRALGMITPLGGVAFIVGWLALAFACWRLHTPEH